MLLKDTDFFAATIYDDTGEVFSKIENKKAIESDNFKINSNIIYVDNTKKEKNIGKIETIFTKHYIYQKMNTESVRIILSNLALIIILIIGLWLSINKFTKPITDLAQIMQKRLTGDYSVEVDPKYLNRIDEIGNISKILQKEMQQPYERKMFNLAKILASGLELINLKKNSLIYIKYSRCKTNSLFLYDKKTQNLISILDKNGQQKKIICSTNNGVLAKVFTENSPLRNKPLSVKEDQKFRDFLDFHRKHTSNTLTLSNQKPIGVSMF